MSVLEQRTPEMEVAVEVARRQDQWISYTSTPQVWTPTTQAVWTSYTTPVGWVTSYTTTTDCDCEYEPTTTSSWCPTPIIVTPTTASIIPIVTTTPASVIVVDHHHHGLSPGAVGGIVIGAFFGVLLLLLLCIGCFRAFRGRGSYGSDTSSITDRRRRRERVIITDPYRRRPDANLTFVGGGNYPGTRVMISKTQKTFIRPTPVKQMRTFRETRTEKIRIIDDDD